MFGKKHLSAASLLVLMMNVFRGHTLTCRPSEYEAGNTCCPMCSAGNRVKTDCSTETSSICQPCTEGTFMNHPTGLKQCFVCAHCDAGSGLRTKMPCTKTSDTVCEPLVGYFCLESTENSCPTAQKHTSCQPGQYIRQKGTAFRDTVCTECSAGTYSDGTFSSCQPHKQCEEMNLQVIKPGTASTDAECGEKSPDQTGFVIGVVVGLLLVVAVAAVFVFYLRKKKGCVNIGDREKNAVKLKHVTNKEDVNGDPQETLRVLEGQT